MATIGSGDGGGKSARRINCKVAAGSVWESRMRIDQVRGGIKVFNGGFENLDGDDKTEDRASEQTSRSSPRLGLAGKRRSSIQNVGNKSPSQIQMKKTSVSNGNGNCKTAVQFQKKMTVSDDDDQRSMVLISKSRSDLKLSKDRGSIEGLEANGLDRFVKKDIGGFDDEIEKDTIPLEMEKSRSDEGDKEDDEDEGVNGSEDDNVNGYASGEDEVKEYEERIDEKFDVEKNISRDEEIVVEKNISDCDYKQMNAMQVNHSNSDSKFASKQQLSSKLTTAITKSSSITEFSPAWKPPPKFSTPHSNPTTDFGLNKRVPQTHNKLQSIVDLVMWKHVPRSSLVFGSGTFMIISSSYTKDINLSFVSVVSYLGLVYLAIMFLYKSFKYRHTMEGNEMNHCHGLVVIGEEEAIWLFRLIHPYLNEFLLKLKALFSGDPAVTMKLAVVLFALARSGNSITIWKMVKLGFFSAFILPKFCSWYSDQITGYGMFWILRFQDAWRSCSHKKVVGLAIFTLVWHLSSVVARIWAAFVLFVAVRYYQQSMIKAESCDEVGFEKGRTCNDDPALQRPLVISKLRQGRRSITSMPMPSTHVDIKAKKGLNRSSNKIRSAKLEHDCS